MEAWGPRYNQLRSASQKEKIKIRNEIYSSYKNAFPESQRTLQQIKKRQQNLEYEYKHLKQRTQKTGEAGIKIIKDGFPYFDYFDEVMGHRDCVNPTKMAVEGSSIFTSTEQKGGSVESEDVPEESSPPASNPSTHSGKKKADNKPAEKSCRKGKRRRRDEQNQVDLLQVNSRQPLWKCGSVVLNKITRDLNVLLKCFARPRTSKWIKQTLYLQVLKTFSKTCCQSRTENELTFFTFRDLYITFVQSKKNVIIFSLNLIMLVPAVTHI